MDAVLSRKRWIAVILTVALCLTAVNLGITQKVYGLTEETGKVGFSNLKLVGELGLLITGSKVNGTKGFQKDIVYLTQEQLEQLKSEKDPSIYGLGKSWRDNQRYSSYDNHGNGTGGYHYTIASGLNISSVLDAVVAGGSNAVENYWIWSTDSYSTNISQKYTEKLKYYAPGDKTGILSAGPMIALYKTTTTATNQSSGIEPAGTPKRLKPSENVFIYGQNDVTDDNNCHYIKAANVLYVGDPETAIRSDSQNFVVKRLKDLMKLGIYQTNYHFSNGTNQITHNLEGVPLQDVLQDMI